MNPYATKTAPATAKKHEVMFAPGVYEEDEDTSSRGRPATDGVSEEIARLRNELRGEARALRSRMARPRVPAELLAELATLRAAVDELMTSPKRNDGLAATLRTRGIEGAAASALARFAKTRSEINSGAKLRKVLGAIIQTTPWVPTLLAKGKTTVALVGPAGVGKTTTAAKMAARGRMAGKTVALISCDGFRVGAMDQLAKYADLMEARFHTATTQDELLSILAKETADLIIIDTSGRAVDPDATEAILGAPEVRQPRNKRHVEVLLCVPASLRARDAARVHRDFASVSPTGLVVTKVDETEVPAGIVHAAFVTRLPVSTLCTGQSVPEDIEGATLDGIADRLFPKNGSSRTTLNAEALSSK